MLVLLVSAAVAVHALDAEEVHVLDGLLRWLRDPRPYFARRAGERADLIVACGNWYDPNKAPVLGALAAELPRAELLLTGGRAERLTPAPAVRSGGEFA